MTPEAYCQEKVQHSSSNFSYSFLFLNNSQRQAMTALYAFCREVDDIVDECSETYIAQAKLHWWRDEIGKIYQGDPTHPVAIALQSVNSTFPLPQSLLLELIDGMEMDLRQQTYADFKELSLYCYRVASVVGLLSIEIFGYSQASTRDFAVNLGIALQLTNILRDVKEDLSRGRLYIPQDEMKQFGVTTAMMKNNQSHPAITALFEHQAQRAEHYYQKAFGCLHQDDRYRQKTAIIMAEIYRSLLKKIIKSEFSVLQHRISVPKLKKLWIAWTTARREYKNQTATLPRAKANHG